MTTWPRGRAYERVAEWTIESQKHYLDPFNDVDVDVIFSKSGQTWRVPTFWRGGQRWTIRFAPPVPGEYQYRLESTDLDNPDLNGQTGSVHVTSYTGPSELVRHGMLRVSSNKRYLEHDDGTPFYWLGDTWYQGLSDRLNWEGFQKLTSDRKSKGFTVVEIVAGLVLIETALDDPGFCNEGGCVWEADFKRINPDYFDYADRRIQLLLDNELLPAVIGGWNNLLGEMGVEKMKKHWRYIIARYGSWPVVWILGGEVVDPPTSAVRRIPKLLQPFIQRGWTEVARYVRATDPYRHPFSVHEMIPPFDSPLQEESLTDFDLFQSGHRGWVSMAISVAQLDMHYARTEITKPIVQGEIGYENHYNRHFEDFQRAAFWLSMLNGAAGHTYGADATWGAQIGEKPLHSVMLSFRSWEEGMNLPGSYQVGLGAKLLRRYRWWLFVPHPEWVTPRGTTLLEPRLNVTGDELGSWIDPDATDVDLTEIDYPKGEWSAKNGTFRQPYAAGIPRETRIIYIPGGHRTLASSTVAAPTVLGLEEGVRYHASLWEPSLGISFDLGNVERPTARVKLFEDSFTDTTAAQWTDYGNSNGVRGNSGLCTQADLISVLSHVNEANVTVAIRIQGNAQAALVMRYVNEQDYISAVYDQKMGAIYLLDRKAGVDGRPLGETLLAGIGEEVCLSAEVRDDKAVVSVTDGERTYTSPIVDLSGVGSGSAGIMHIGSTPQIFSKFELCRSPVLVTDEDLQRKLYDARGGFRGELVGSASHHALSISKTGGWSSFGRDKHILLDAYRPERLPHAGDWVLILEVVKNDVD